MRRFGLGRNESNRDQTFTHVMAVEFGTKAQLESYLSSGLHEDFVKTVFRPNVEDRAIASFPWEEPGVA